MDWAQRFMGDATITALLSPVRLHTAAEVAAQVSSAPKEPGIYTWYFDAIPPDINVSACHTIGGWSLLYTGISPKKPPTNGRKPSKSHIHQRLCTHLTGNAARSTLRLTLGCLLEQEIGTILRRLGTRKPQRFTFTDSGEQFLSRWMYAHARVAWVEHSAPWEPEEMLLASGLPLPLNIKGNPCAALTTPVKERRCAARRQAEALPPIGDSGGPRRFKTGAAA